MNLIALLLPLLLPLVRAGDVMNAFSCEGAQLTITCPAGQEIAVRDALYGRGGTTICPNNPILTTDCSASSALIKVKEMCQGKGTCSITASNAVFGDPCSGTTKYLEVNYYCKPIATNANACERSGVTLTCPKGKLIVIRDALYGRTDATICPNQPILNTACSASNAEAVVKDRCEGKETCTISASNSVFGDPCRGTTKYLDVNYFCEDNKVYGKVACENDFLLLSCCAKHTIEVIEANYGRSDAVTCAKQPIQTTQCYEPTTTDIVKGNCDGLSQCKILASNDVFSDPCQGTTKYLQVSYICRKPEKGTKSACENQSLVLKCATGWVLNIVSANYGRLESVTCPAGPINTEQCSASTSLEQVRTRCQGLNECSVQASNGVFGDPCQGTTKYLQVSYECTRSRL